MYSEQFMKYLLKYQHEDMKPAERKPKKHKLTFGGMTKKKYATVPVNQK